MVELPSSSRWSRRAEVEAARIAGEHRRRHHVHTLGLRAGGHVLHGVVAVSVPMLLTSTPYPAGRRRHGQRHAFARCRHVRARPLRLPSSPNTTNPGDGQVVAFAVWFVELGDGAGRAGAEGDLRRGVDTRRSTASRCSVCCCPRRAESGTGAVVGREQRALCCTPLARRTTGSEDSQGFCPARQNGVVAAGNRHGERHASSATAAHAPSECG